MIVCDDVEYRGTAMDYPEETQELTMNFVFLEGVVASNIIPRSKVQSGGDVDYAAQPPQLSRLRGRGSARPQGEGKGKVLPKLYLVCSKLSMRPCGALSSLWI